MSDDDTKLELKKPLIEAISIQLPPTVAVDKSIKAQIIQGTKDAIATLHGNEALDKEMDFDTILNEPANLKHFFEVFKDNIDLFAETVVDKSGDPITDETTETACGVTLQQVKKLLISTATRRFFVRNDGKVITKKQKKKVKTMMFFTKEVTVKKKVKLKEGAAKFDVMKRIIGFDWQLDLLEFYRDELPDAHMLVLGDDLLVIQDIKRGQEVVSIHHEDFKKVKESVGVYFRNVVAHGAAAIPGILYWRKDLVMAFIKAMGEGAWDFFKREKEFFDHCTELDNARIGIYGDTLAYIAHENLTELNRLNLDRLEATLGAWKDTFSDNISEILSEPLLSTDILRPMVDSFIHLEAKDNGQFKVGCRTAVSSLKEEVLAFIKEAKARHAEEAANTADLDAEEENS
ncbi:conserved hypothetical protein [Candidatus Terasakiella magnetica]|uniref:Uncharacterized protein n=1 Tax=Candidatus Terasakiella magnetica TaxID=1867952 RepID=A0A1C3RGM5_9PROT|nr:hypothetical protein [Candidatus Terasakiella magnetica]SCA56457.1 conserved hypothetical protein [Candidatus Terasakiella magnetica]